MRRREFISLLSDAAARPLVAHAQQCAARLQPQVFHDAAG